MLFKVYSRACVRPAGKYIVEANKEDLDEAMALILDEAEERGLIDTTTDDDIDYKKLEAAYDKIQNYFNKNKILNAGDWKIQEADSIDEISVPNSCGNDAGFIF